MELKALVYGRTGAEPKASNNKEGAMVAEARAALARELMLPPTPAKADATRADADDDDAAEADDALDAL